MSRKLKTVDLLSQYFVEKGKVLTRTEYVNLNDGPLSLPAIKRSCGSWSRMISICERTFPDRMNQARQSEPVEALKPVKKPEPEVPAAVPSEGDPVKTAADALAKLKEKTNA